MAKMLDIDVHSIYEATITLIKEARTKDNSSQNSIAYGIGIVPSTYNRIETLQTKLSLENFYKICRFLGLKPDSVVRKAVIDAHPDYITSQELPEEKMFDLLKEIDDWKKKYHDLNGSLQMIKRYNEVLEKRIERLEKGGDSLESV